MLRRLWEWGKEGRKGLDPDYITPAYRLSRYLNIK